MRLLLLHLSGADWRFIHPLVDKGLLPSFERLVNEGCIGTLFTQAPLISPLTSVTLATGCHPDKHGVLAPVQPSDASPGYRPTQSSDWSAPALWELVAARGGAAAAVGWPGTFPVLGSERDPSPHPPEATVLSDVFVRLSPDAAPDPQSFGGPGLDPEVLADLRMRPEDVTEDMLTAFLSEGGRIDLETDPRPGMLIESFAAACTTHNAALHLAGAGHLDLLAVHFDWLAAIKSAFLQYGAPQMGHVSDTDHVTYRGVVDMAYRLMDQFLGAYFEIATPDTRVMLVSDHGYHSGDLRPGASAHQGGQLATQRREIGVLAVSGPGLLKDALVSGTVTEDVVPTALALLNLAPEADLPGKMRRDVFEQSPPDLAPVKTPRRPASEPAELTEADGLRLALLAARGEIDVPPNDLEMAQAWAARMAAGNLLMFHITRRDHEQVLSAADALLEHDPDNAAALLSKARSFLALGRAAEAQSIADDLKGSSLSPGRLALLDAQIAQAEGDNVRQLAALAEAEADVAPGVTGLRHLEEVGAHYLQAKQYDDAARVYGQALVVDASSARAHAGLGRAQLGQGRLAEAEACFRASLAKLQVQPLVQAHLGQALERQLRFKDAHAAYSAALSMAPGLELAEQGLARLARHEAKLTVSTLADGAAL